MIFLILWNDYLTIFLHISEKSCIFARSFCVRSKNTQQQTTMNNENQNIEYKRIWQDDNLKSICAFANAQGGVMYIGIDDDGQVLGLDNVHKWQEDIPNKIVQNLGIVCEINTQEEFGKTFVCPVLPCRFTPNIRFQCYKWYKRYNLTSLQPYKL